MKDVHINKINKIASDPNNRIDEIKSISSAAAGLYGWVRSTVNLYEVHKKVNPLKKKVEEMTIKQQQLQEDLSKTEQLLKDLDSQLTELNINREKKQAILDELTE